MLDHSPTHQMRSARVVAAPAGALVAAKTIVSRHATVGRLAWVFADRETALLLRQPLMVEAIRRGHHVLALAPGFTPEDHRDLADAGIACASISYPAQGFNPLGRLTARRRIVRALRKFGANTVLIEDGENLSVAARAARLAGVVSIFPILPSLEGTRPRAPDTGGKAASNVSWRTALRFAAGVFVPTPNDQRMMEEPLRKFGLASNVLPVAAHDLGVVGAELLPPLQHGFVFFGLRDRQSKPDSTAYAEASAVCDARNGRVRFEMADIASGETRDSVAVAAAAAPGSVELSLLEGNLVTALLRRVQTAHCVVIDDVGAAHTLLLTIAMALGRPVLVIDDAHYRGLVDAGVNGWLVTPHDPAALAERMGALLRRPDLLAGMARSARQKAERRVDHRASVKVLFGVLGLADLKAEAA